MRIRLTKVDLIDEKTNLNSSLTVIFNLGDNKTPSQVTLFLSGLQALCILRL